MTAALMLVGCGEKGQDTATTESVLTSNSKAIITEEGSIKTEDGSFARLVKALTDLQCTADNFGQLIYVKSEGSFYYCDDETTEWTSIDLKGADGQDGANGADGKDGAQGIAGKDGVDGVDGQDGANGQDGQDGQDGEAVMLVATYTFNQITGNTIGGNSALTANYLQASLFSDGSIHVSGEIINSSSIYSPSFFIGASQKASPEITRLTNYMLSSKTLAIRTTAGQDALNGHTTYGNQSSFTIGISVVNNGANIDTGAMTYFTLTYNNGGQ